MRIACLSGKGGAGKTMVAVNLAIAIGADTYVDCDVEEPNGCIFLKPKEIEKKEVSIMLPAFDADKCNGCKKCVQFCRFHALMYIKEKPVVFPEVCHSCGGCMMVCPEGAIKETPKPMGTIETGKREHLTVVTGILNPGEASGVPVIQAALKEAKGLTVIDCPPGSACAVMESISEADYCLIVAEPTAFGFHNFQMVHELVTIMKKDCGVVINKEEERYEPLEKYCREKKLEVLERIPYSKEMATSISEGRLVPHKLRALAEKMGGIQ